MRPERLIECSGIRRYQSYVLAFTPSVVATQYAGGVAGPELVAAGYVHFEGDKNWWLPSAIAVYPVDPRAHFYVPKGSKDALGTETIVTLDQFDLLVEKVEVT
ncbi:MAG TPA: hypothetical protein VGL19_11190, partial [Polyangiaceae bacterium]